MSTILYPATVLVCMWAMVLSTLAAVALFGRRGRGRALWFCLLVGYGALFWFDLQTIAISLTILCLTVLLWAWRVRMERTGRW